MTRAVVALVRGAAKTTLTVSCLARCEAHSAPAISALACASIATLAIRALSGASMAALSVTTLVMTA